MQIAFVYWENSVFPLSFPVLEMVLFLLDKNSTPKLYPKPKDKL